MPINYANYHPEWKTRIRPDILKRADNKCEQCGVPNYLEILRGTDCYQDEHGNIFDAETSEKIGANYVGEIPGCNGKFVKVVLTIAHLDHNIENNDYDNLKAWCQRCHNRYDRENRNTNRRANKQLKEPTLF